MTPTKKLRSPARTLSPQVSRRRSSPAEHPVPHSPLTRSTAPRSKRRKLDNGAKAEGDNDEEEADGDEDAENDDGEADADEAEPAAAEFAKKADAALPAAEAAKPEEAHEAPKVAAEGEKAE